MNHFILDQTDLLAFISHRRCGIPCGHCSRPGSEGVFRIGTYQRVPEHAICVSLPGARYLLCLYEPKDPALAIPVPPYLR